MARTWAQVLLGFAALLPPVLPVAAQPLPAHQAVVLRDHQESVDAAALPRVWVDSSGAAAIRQVATREGLARFGPPVEGTIHRLGTGPALWMHFRLQRGHGSRQDWVLEFPMPLLDRVTVYQSGGKGWRGETAGDTLPVASWPQAGRYPAFRLQLPPGEVRDVLVRIQHVTAADFPVRLSTETGYGQRIQRAYLGLGTTFGALLLLIAICLTQGWVYRDRVYLWYAGYAALITATAASYTGALQHLLLPRFGALADAPVPMLSIAAIASALLFVRSLVGVAARHPLLDRLVQGWGLLGLALALLPAVLPKLPALGMMSFYVITATLASMAIAAAGWRRGDVVGAWVFAAFVPLALSTAMGVLRVFGGLPVSFGTQYAVVLAMTIEVPLLLVALSIRTRDRHGAEIREQALSTQDALTGLLAPHLFHDRLRQVVARHKRDRESAAILFIDLANHGRIKELYGTAVAEQSLLRTVIKLRRLLRDVDTVSRVDEARFAVILEGVASRAAVTDRAARLIAAGLMPLSGLKPDVTLQFHIAAVLLDERPLEAPDVVEQLAALLAGMSPRTRRPIRFITPENTQPAPLAPDSSLMGAEEESATALSN